ETATKTVSPPASIALRRMVRSTCSRGANSLAALEPHPDLAVLEVLLLPHRHRALERVDRVAAGLEGIAAVRGGDGDEHARLADLESPGAVEHRDTAHPGPARAHGPADLAHLRLGHRRGRLVHQRFDRATAGLVSHDAGEDHDPASARLVDLRGDRVGRERLAHDAKDVGGGSAAHGRKETELVLGLQAMSGAAKSVPPPNNVNRPYRGGPGIRSVNVCQDEFTVPSVGR